MRAPSSNLTGKLQQLVQILRHYSPWWQIILSLILITATKRYVYFDEHISQVSACHSHGWSERSRPVKIWDTVPINSELDILEARLNELDSVVDTFVIVEAPYAFSGKKKPLYFNENKERFAKFLHKINHIMIPDFVPPPGVDVNDDKVMAIARKVEAKNGVHRGLVDAHPDDLILSTDLDEIPRKEVIHQLKHCSGYTTPVELWMDAFIFDFGCFETHGSQWRKPKVVYYKELDSECDGTWDGMACVNELRDNQHLGLGLFRFPTSIAHAGWHMSYFMSTQKIVEKVGSYAHIERNTATNRNVDHLECLISKCRHVNGQDSGTRLKYPVVGPTWTYQQYKAGIPAYQQYYERTLDSGACARSEVD